MSRERLHRLRGQLGFDPARHGEVSEAMPIEALDCLDLIEQRLELPFDQVVVSDMSAVPVWEDQIVRF
jgi:hypothetical protein